MKRVALRLLKHDREDERREVFVFRSFSQLRLDHYDYIHPYYLYYINISNLLGWSLEHCKVEMIFTPALVSGAYVICPCETAWNILDFIEEQSLVGKRAPNRSSESPSVTFIIAAAFEGINWDDLLAASYSSDVKVGIRRY